ncbi:hypothetical protein PIB30_087064 [Stylosanthes scabra]|uniref:Uncharacterized protein n=1 Tax=Stylosanthes scabra TaxID=79078 RepID=A0ABU6XT53_9FABA|nr:hypothetical protein [Stylosanthes scabra]
MTTARSRLCAPMSAPLRQLSELVKGDRAPAHLRRRVCTVASGAKIIRAKMEFPSFRVRAQPLLQALLDPINGRTAEDTKGTPPLGSISSFRNPELNLFATLERPSIKDRSVRVEN